MNEVLTCAYCGKQFQAKIRSGPPPKYCSQAHRQRAYQDRRRTTEPDQVEKLEARVRLLEYDNRKLREALDASEAYAQQLEDQLRPPRPGREHLYGIDPTAIPEPPAPTTRWRRGRRTN
ncbi:MAG TPA: hypothetical protein VG899_15515 [Mycobacteriales bacterium]|jgi:hypothetical protein|nr:hypothetical protein [Mycobacteriales bacterium]HWA67769.1 hypothetical protein [Mycobacteriales bacterium]